MKGGEEVGGDGIAANLSWFVCGTNRFGPCSAAIGRWKFYLQALSYVNVTKEHVCRNAFPITPGARISNILLPFSDYNNIHLCLALNFLELLNHLFFNKIFN